MSVKNLVAFTMLWSLFTLGNTAQADVFTPPSATAGVRDDFLTPNSIFAVAGNLLKQASSSLPREDQITHTKTLIWAASNLQNGQMAEWNNPNNGTAGRTKIVLTKPVQGGYCRMLYTLVEKEGIVKDYTEYACKTIDSQFWTFSTR